MDTPPAASTRASSRKKLSQMADAQQPNGSSSSTSTSSSSPSSSRPSAAAMSTPPSRKRNPPFLPTTLEGVALAAYPVLLVFGTLFALLDPQTRAAPYDARVRAHTQDPALVPSYFARKDNLLNVLFVKRGWAWITGAFFLFVFTHPAMASGRARAKATVRWGLVTLWWVLVTQWCFGPPIIDRGFRFTGGKCEVAEMKMEEAASAAAAAGQNVKAEVAEIGEALTAAACRVAGGRWSGGHDISGHVFLLVMGSFFLLQEVGWVAMRWRRLHRAGRDNKKGALLVDERTVVMHDGAVKSAEVEAEAGAPHQGAGGEGGDALGIGGKAVGAVVALCLWMLLMTAIYFHTWFEKLTGLLVALLGLYGVYILPRLVPAVRAIVGIPGV